MPDAIPRARVGGGGSAGGGAIVQQEQQEEQQEAPAAEPSTILEQAAENGIAVQDSEDSTVENAVAEVTVNGSTTPYADIDAAFAAAQQADSATVKLLADVTIRHEGYSGIKLEKGNITLDLNGKTLSKSTRDDNVFYARNAVFWLSPPEATTKDEFLAALQTHARLTVQDSSADGSGKIVQPNGGPAVIVALNTILTVNGGTIDNASSVDLDDDSHLKPNCAVLLSGGGKAVINGGTLRGMRGVAVTGYITKEVEGLYKDTFGIEGYNNDTYGNELTVTGGNICATSGEGLIVYEKAKKIELSGGTFTTQSNAYSIWVADTEAEGEPTIKGDASSLLASGYRYENNGTECVYSEDGKGVAGNATVALRPANEYAYIDKNGNLATQANCTEITAETWDISQLVCGKRECHDLQAQYFRRGQPDFVRRGNADRHQLYECYARQHAEPLLAVCRYRQADGGGHQCAGHCNCTRRRNEADHRRGWHDL